MYKNGKILGIGLIALIIFSVFSTFTVALAIDNNCPINVITIFQVTPALLCLENRIDVLENTPISGGSGEANTASNLGSIGEGWFNSKVGVDLQFKKAVAGTGITLQSNGTRVMINSTGASGEANTISCDSFTNGQCIVSGKVGVDLQLKNVVSADSKISITSNSSHIIFTDNVTGESTVCSNATSSAGHFGLCKDNLITLRTLKPSTGISMSLNSTDITVTNTGVISNSCSAGIICSGTNPSLISPKWELLCSNELVANATTLNCNSFTAREHLRIMVEFDYASNGTSITASMRFNNDGGTNYAIRYSTSGGADSTSTNRADILINSSESPNGGSHMECWIDNNFAIKRKLVYCLWVSGENSPDTTVPVRIELAGKWDNTASQITTINILRNAGNGAFGVGSAIAVWGYDT